MVFQDLKVHRCFPFVFNKCIISLYFGFADMSHNQLTHFKNASFMSNTSYIEEYDRISFGDIFPFNRVQNGNNDIYQKTVEQDKNMIDK